MKAGRNLAQPVPSRLPPDRNKSTHSPTHPLSSLMSRKGYLRKQGTGLRRCVYTDPYEHTTSNTGLRASDEDERNTHTHLRSPETLVRTYTRVGGSSITLSHTPPVCPADRAKVHIYIDRQNSRRSLSVSGAETRVDIREKLTRMWKIRLSSNEERAIQNFPAARKADLLAKAIATDVPG